MCGIIGVVGDSNVALRLLDGLRRLEYRGYDSAGIATVESSAIHRRRAEGKIVNLEQRMEVEPLSGDIGIAHTRWATHGAANETNAHPHSDGHVAIVHNGIIENFQALRARLVTACDNGHGVPQNNQLSYMWINISGANGSDVGRVRELITRRMSQAEIVKAQQMTKQYTIDNPNVY